MLGKVTLISDLHCSLCTVQPSWHIGTVPNSNRCKLSAASRKLPMNLWFNCVRGLLVYFIAILTLEKDLIYVTIIA